MDNLSVGNKCMREQMSRKILWLLLEFGEIHYVRCMFEAGKLGKNMIRISFNALYLDVFLCNEGRKDFNPSFGKC